MLRKSSQNRDSLKKPFLNHAGVKLLIGTPSFLGVTEKRCDHFEHIVFLRNWEINILPFSLHGFPAPFRRRFPALPLGGHRRVSHADGHAVFKVQQAKRQQKSRHKTDQPCLRFFWKVMLVGYVTAERICKNMLYSIVGIDYHKNRAVSTKSFENTSLSAVCKKKQGKLWQKERGLDGASPLDKVRIVPISHNYALYASIKRITIITRC